MVGRFTYENDTKRIKTSIDDFIELIVFSAHGSFKADYYFGFVFQNTKFQNSDEGNHIEDLKINGNSVNRDNYAYELKQAIEEYETRLKNVQVAIGYETEQKRVSIDVSGWYEEDYVEKEYNKNITFYIW
jgi:hypothetical protein